MSKTIDEQIKCVKREISLRTAVYAAQVRGGRLKPEDAAHEVACMEAVLETLERVKAQPSLF